MNTTAFDLLQAKKNKQLEQPNTDQTDYVDELISSTGAKQEDTDSHTDTYADLIIEYLRQLNIEYIFGVPGGAIEPLFNALARSERNGGPKVIVARHETAAAFMADGYFRETGKMGVVCSTTGPGATNLITGVSSAYVDNISMMVITAQTALPKFGKSALQDSSCTAVDTVGMFRHCTVFNTLVSHPEQMENKLVSAVMAAHRVPNGPVHLSVPSDILGAAMPVSASKHIHADLFVHDFVMTDAVATEKLKEKLAKVDTLSVLIGKGAGKAAHKIVEFCELTNSPFVTGPVSKAWIDENHKLYRGVYGFAGHESADNLFKNTKTDLILAVGISLGELNTAGWTNDILNTRLIHIDSSMEHFTRSPMANLHVCGNISAIFERLVENVKSARKWGRQWSNASEYSKPNVFGGYPVIENSHKCFVDSSPVKPQRLMYYLSKKLPENVRVYIDAGNIWSWATHYFQRSSHTGEYQIAMGFGSMAWSVGASIGACLGGKKVPTLCIIGDGSYLMSSQEITVAQQLQLPLIFIILNDSALGMVMHGQKLGNAESIGWEISKINFAKMAEAMGVNNIEITDSRQLNDLNWNKLFAMNGPTLIDITIDRSEVPLMVSRVRGLKLHESGMPGA